MSPRYLGGENKKEGEATARAVFRLRLISSKFSDISQTFILQPRTRAVVCGAPYLVPSPAWVPGADFRELRGSSLPPYLHLGLRGRASLPDVHRKQGWGWAGRGGEENGGLAREAVQDRRSSLLLLSGAPNTGFGICRKGGWNCP